MIKKCLLIFRLNIITKLLENNQLPLNENDFIDLIQSITKCLNIFKDTNSTKYLIM